MECGTRTRRPVAREQVGKGHSWHVVHDQVNVTASVPDAQQLFGSMRKRSTREKEHKRGDWGGGVDPLSRTQPPATRTTVRQSDSATTAIKRPKRSVSSCVSSSSIFCCLCLFVFFFTFLIDNYFLFI